VVADALEYSETHMEHDQLALYVASYDDDAAANDDFQALKDAREVGLEIVGAW
jgi:hypothetical protein